MKKVITIIILILLITTIINKHISFFIETNCSRTTRSISFNQGCYSSNIEFERQYGRSIGITNTFAFTRVDLWLGTNCNSTSPLFKDFKDDVCVISFGRPLIVFNQVKYYAAKVEK
jgi:hypothetical protein